MTIGKAEKRMAAEVEPPFVRSPYNYDRNAASDESGHPGGGEVLTVQSQKEDADINVIVKRYGLTGQMPPQGTRAPTFGDFDGVNDYQTALNAIIAARDSFMAMPADVRAEFANDPQRFVEFCSDEKNLPRLRELGLANPEPIRHSDSGSTVATTVKGNDDGKSKADEKPAGGGAAAST